MRSIILTIASVLIFPAIAFALDFNNTAIRYKDYGEMSTAERVAVSVLTNIAAVEGNPDGTFRPNRNLNRAEFVKIVLRLGAPSIPDMGLPSESCFPDVKRADWFSPYVCFAKTRGILAGYPNGYFHPERNVNYAEALKILVNLYEYPLTGITEVETEPWYMPYVRAAEIKKVMLQERIPYDHLLTRGQMARLAAAFLAQSEGKLPDYRKAEGMIGGMAPVKDGYFPIFVRNIYALEIDKPGLLEHAKKAGVNTLTLGFFQTPAYLPHITNLEEFKQASDANDLATFWKYSAAGWYIVGSGDNIDRTNVSLNWVLNTEWSKDALAYILEQLAGVPRVLGIDLMDEPNYVYGFDDPLNPPRDILANLCLPSDAFTKLLQKMNTARVKPRLGWNTSSPQWVQYIGDWATTENHAGEDCVDPGASQYLYCSKKVRDKMLSARKMVGDTEKIALVNVSGMQLPGYEKWSPGELYAPGKDRLLMPTGQTMEDYYAHAAMQQWASAALGYSGVRVYSYDAKTYPRDVRKESLITGTYAWTPSGLQRANLSRSWTPIGKPPSSLSSINALFQYGSLFVGTDQGVYQATGELLDTWTLIAGTEGKKVLSFGLDTVSNSNGTTFMGTDKGVFKFNDFSVQATDPCGTGTQAQTVDTASSPVKQVSGIPEVRILAMTNRGWNWEPGMYVGTQGKGLYVVHGDKGEKVEGIPDVTVHALHVTSDGKTLFVGTNDGLYVFSFVEGGWIPLGEKRHLLKGTAVYSFLQQWDGTMGIGTEQGYYDYRGWLEGDSAFSLNSGIPGPVTHLAYVNDSGYEGEGWIHARTPSGIYAALIGQPALEWKKDVLAPANARGLLFVNYGPQQVGASEDGAPYQRRMWETITKTFALMAELEKKILTPVVKEEFPNENAVISLRRGNGWQLLMAVNGTKDPLEVDPRSHLGTSVKNPRARLIRGPDISEKPYGRITLPPWSTLVVETTQAQ